MGRTIMITSGDGDVGKTTATAYIGTALAMRGREVVLVDADFGLRNLEVVLGLEGRVVSNSMDIVEGRCELSEALVRGGIDNLWLLPAPQGNYRSHFPPEQLKDICNELRESFDWCLIDSPVGYERGFQITAQAADEAVIITTPEVVSVRNADRVIGLLYCVGIENPSLILNRFSPEMVKRNDMMRPEDVVEFLSIELLGVVPEDEGIIASARKGLPLPIDEDSKSGKAFGRIARRIDGERDVPIPEFKDEGWLKKPAKLLTYLSNFRNIVKSGMKKSFDSTRNRKRGETKCKKK